MNIDKSRHRYNHVWSFIRQSERGIFEAIFLQISATFLKLAVIYTVITQSD